MTSQTNTFGLEPDDLIIFNKIIQSIPYPIYIYGSRAKGAYTKFSDIDLCIMVNIDDLELFYIKEKFADSDLPMKVDIKRWNDLNADFQSLIKPDLILIHQVI